MNSTDNQNTPLKLPMEDILNYLDYREYLRDHFNESKKKHSFFSFRYVAGKTGLDASFYVKVLNKRLGRKAYIDLDNPSFESAIDLLISVGIILPERKADLLANGTEQEAYNGVL